MHGESSDAITNKLATMLQGADQPYSEEAVASLLDVPGLDRPQRFFSSCFGARGSRRTAP
jgi:tRNA (cmo5U34)-methyltransferase